MDKNAGSRIIRIFEAVLIISLSAVFLLAGIQGNIFETARAASKTAYSVYVKEGPLTIRKSASTSSENLGAVPKKKTLTSTLRKKVSGVYWYRITYQKKNGYICGKYVKLKASDVTYDSKSLKKGKTTDALSVRESHSLSSKRITTLSKGKSLTIMGWYKKSGDKKWYKIRYSGKTGYVCADYVKISSSSSDPSGPSGSSGRETGSMTSGQFEEYMTAQGFPEAYKPYLRTLHKAHPKWVFKAQKTGISWSKLVSKETSIGTNLVSSGSPPKYKKKNILTYNYVTGKYIGFDGSHWNQASDKLIKYYLDPRNFLNETSVYQFLNHNYHSEGQNTDTVKSITSMNSNCFMNNTKHINWIVTAGKDAKVNPNVITAMIVQEQGWSGTSGLISGTYKGYKGYYNHFNIGAYSTLTMNAVQRGLWYAKGEGKGNTSYGRPWNTRYKSIKGGAIFYKECYLDNRQYTYYTKKFNVMNGASKAGDHQYMTNVMGADSEGKILKYAYRNSSDYAMIFYVPVYSSMPAKACAKP